MRIDAINGRVYSSALHKSSIKNISAKNNSKSTKPCDILSFSGNNSAKGIGIGAVFGLAAMGAISAMSGGAAVPFAYGMYAAAFGTAGGLAGKALDDMEKDEKNRSK